MIIPRRSAAEAWCRGCPQETAEQILAAYREQDGEACFDFPVASFHVQTPKSRVFGRGIYSGDPVYYLSEPGSSGAGTAPPVSTSLRKMGRLVDYQPDPLGVRDYLCYGFVPAPRTIFKGIRALLPGTICISDEAGNAPRWVRWRAAASRNGRKPARAFWRRLGDTVRRSEATALLLSGGLDSSIVAAAAVEAGAPLFGCHARFREVDPDRDEDTLAARDTARHLGIQYGEIQIGARDALRNFQRVVTALDQPLGDPVILPFFLLLERIRKHHRVALTGEGGDQLFGSWSMKPMLVRECYGESDYSRSQAYLESFHKFDSDWTELVSPRIADRLAKGSPPDMAAREAWESSPYEDLRETIRWVDIRLKGLQHILPRIESMARAQDVRLVHPLFDADLIDLSFTLQHELKLHLAREKVLLKELAERRLPDHVIHRRKAGMGVPTRVWFRGKLGRLARRWLNPRRLRRSGLLDPVGVKQILRRDKRTADARLRRWGDRLWMLCVLECWFATLPTRRNLS